VLLARGAAVAVDRGDARRLPRVSTIEQSAGRRKALLFQQGNGLSRTTTISVVGDDTGGVDLSPLHAALDQLKAQLCRCQHQGTCLACRGFEVIRQQVQVVVAAASQPVLMQVAQEVAVKDLMTQLGGLQEKLAEDPQLQELMARLFERVQDDLGGAENVQRMFGSMFGGEDPSASPEDREIPPDDRPSKPRPEPDRPVS
jgi:hypothetical protein